MQAFNIDVHQRHLVSTYCIYKLRIRGYAFEKVTRLPFRAAMSFRID